MSSKFYRKGSEHGEWMGDRTRWCDTCKKRHHLDHAHFREVPAAGGGTTAVAGAETGEELARQAEAEVGRLAPRPPREPRKTRAEVEQAAEAKLRRTNACRRLARAECGMLAKFHDEAWGKLTESDLRELGEAWADMAEAFGVNTASKWFAPIVLIAVHAELYSKVTGGKDEKETTEVP